MKLRGTIFFSLLIAATLLVGFYPNTPPTQGAPKDAVLVQTMMMFINELHYDPRVLDDAFSKNLYKYYLDELDGYRRFLTQEDLKKLAVHETQLDNQIKSTSVDFFEDAYTAFNASLTKTQGFYREILASPFDFSQKESFEMDSEKRPFAKNDAELKDLWRKYLKYETMSRLIEKLELQEKEASGNAEIPKKSTAELEQEAREATLKTYNEYFERLLKIKRSDRFDEYLNALSAMFDPHTNYFAPIEKQNFDIRFSGRLEGIGATLQNQGDYTRVASIVVGGPAWKGKELQENDLIMKVAQGTDGEWQDISGMVVNDVVQYIRGKKGTTVRLQVKKVDGTIKTIQIVRDIVQIEDTYARSLLIDSEDSQKIGYIYLPSFYADFNDPNGRFCSKDIEKELEKLKAQDVSGIILDLRNNGGGSLRDVQRMTGFFIEAGPVVQVKSRTSSPEVLRDMDKRVQYSGPLVVMVNNLSASASEILAAALQDYGRALIVGSTTYGKGTVQRFFDLDQGISGNDEIKPLGEVKITTQKFYRVNGGSTQLKGVTPDILLPDEFQLSEVGERQESYPLEWTQIAPVSYGQSVFKIKNLDALRKNSLGRVEKDPVFQQVTQNVTRLKNYRDASLVSLNLDAFRSSEKVRKQEAEAFKNIYPKDANKNVRNLPEDLSALAADESAKARNDEFVQSVASDIYIRETIHILRDLMRQ